MKFWLVTSGHRKGIKGWDRHTHHTSYPQSQKHCFAKWIVKVTLVIPMKKKLESTSAAFLLWYPYPIRAGFKVGSGCSGGFGAHSFCISSRLYAQLLQVVDHPHRKNFSFFAQQIHWRNLLLLLFDISLGTLGKNQSTSLYYHSLDCGSLTCVSPMPEPPLLQAKPNTSASSLNAICSSPWPHQWPFLRWTLSLFCPYSSCTGRLKHGSIINSEITFMNIIS